MAIEDTVYEGKNLDEAISSASSALGIPEGELHYEIVEQGRRGIFGLGAKSVQIRIKPPLDEPPSTETEIEPIVLEDPEAAQSAPAPRAAGDPAAAPARAEARGNGDRRPRKRRRRKRGGANREGDGGERKAAAGPARSGESAGEATRPQRTTVTDEEIGAVDGTVRKMIELMGLDLTTECAATNGGVAIELSGDDREMLMERNAELLGSIQFLLNRMARRAWPGVRRVQLVCEGKKSQRRDDDLVELVREVAQQVSRTGRTKKLEPMNAYERRLVHITIREYTGLTSSSDGNGSMKRVRISKVTNEI